jgi:hypothetical protein
MAIEDARAQPVHRGCGGLPLQKREGKGRGGVRLGGSPKG